MSNKCNTDDICCQVTAAMVMVQEKEDEKE